MEYSFIEKIVAVSMAMAMFSLSGLIICAIIGFVFKFIEGTL